MHRPTELTCVFQLPPSRDLAVVCGSPFALAVGFAYLRPFFQLGPWPARNKFFTGRPLFHSNLKFIIMHTLSSWLIKTTCLGPKTDAISSRYRMEAVQNWLSECCL